MEIGLGHLRYPPAVFWGLSLLEFDAAHNGYLESLGVKTGTTAPAKMSQSRMSELMALYPDAPHG